jgi:hypothetical protein
MSKSAVTLQPGQISTKWGTNLKQAMPSIQAGIDAVTVSPGEKAANAQDKYLNGVQRAVSGGRFAAGCRSFTLQDWKTRAKEKTQTRLSGGVDAAMPKRQRFDTWLVNTLNGLLPSIASMPDMTLEDSIARATAMIRGMAANPYKK